MTDLHHRIKNNIKVYVVSKTFSFRFFFLGFIIAGKTIQIFNTSHLQYELPAITFIHDNKYQLNWQYWSSF